MQPGVNYLDYLWILLPEVVLSLWGMLLLLIDVFQKGDRTEPSHPSIPWIALIGIGLAAAANALLAGYEGSTAATAGMIALDDFRIFSNYLFLLAAALFVLVSDRYFRQEHMSLGELYVLALFATVGMMFFAGANDLIVIFLGLEVMSVAVYVLTGLNRRDPRSGEGALKYFLLCAFSSACFLFGVAFVYGGTASTNLTEIALAIGTDGLGANTMLLAGMALLITGFAFKVAAVPFHMWTPDAYEGAPLPITAYLSATSKAAGFALLIRLFSEGLLPVIDDWQFMVAAIAALTMIMGNLVALQQHNIKRLLAYSSIGQVGYMLAALTALSPEVTSALLMHMVGYVITNVAAFTAIIAYHNASGAEEVHDFRGMSDRAPVLAAVLAGALFSLAGMPLFAGFLTKFILFQSIWDNGYQWLAVVAVVASLISLYYYLQVMREAYVSQA